VEGTLRPSSYILHFALPFRGRALVMHGYTGAIDIMSTELVNHLTNGNGEFEVLDREVRQSLVDRGYLVTASQEEESSHVSKLFGVFERRLRGTIALGLRLTGPTEGLRRGVLANPADLFAGLNTLRQFYVGSALAVDVSAVTGPLDFLPELAALSQQWSYSLLLTIRTAQLAAVAGQLDTVKPPFLRVITAEALPEDVASFFEGILESGVRCDWLLSLDALSSEAAEQAADLARQLKPVATRAKTPLNALFVSEKDLPLPANLLDDSEVSPTLTLADVPLYHHVSRFVELPGLVNLRPYFTRPDVTYILDNSGTILRPRQGDGRGEATEVGRLVGGTVEFAREYDPLADTRQATEFVRCEPSESCPFALVCGVHCGAPVAENGSCRSVFQTRIERIAPSIIFNKIQVS
jgi:hypothetical protein